MWVTVLLINSILLSICSLVLVYSIGAMILLGQWRLFLLFLILVIFLILSEIALAAIAEP